MATCYAHTWEGCPVDDWELLEDHLRLVAGDMKRFAGAAGFASVFGCPDWGRLVGLWHDLGKYSAEFQSYLHASAGDRAAAARKGPDHSTAGAQHAAAALQGPVGRILAYCIAGHHGGLPDAEGDGGGRSGLNERLKKQIFSFDRAPDEFLAMTALAAPAFDWSKNGNVRSFQLSVFCRMLFSCLVDADFLATEQFMNRDRAALRPSEGPSLDTLLDHLNTRLGELEQDRNTASVNVKRREVLAACRDKAGLLPGLFSLTVPTGGGKTLSSLAFALTHAVRYGLRRVIYAIPFTSIIEQNASVFRDVLAAAGDDVVLEHHSNFDREKTNRGSADEGETFRDLLASENWDAPIVVTTNVQLFESLFANKPSRCRKLHRIAKSVIVLDEVQTLPVELLRPTLAMLDELCRNYGCTVALCSATQPAIEWRDGFSIGLQNVREIVADPPALFLAMKRVDVVRIGQIDDVDLAARLADHEQVLCIVNTRDHAAAIFRSLKSHVGEGVFHLSASMCPAHRTNVLRAINVRLDPDNPKACRVVSTQLVEAGVDIDFPVVYRAMTGVDSIAQAAGRCNREGRRDRGQVFVFDTHVNPRGDLRERRQVGEEVALLHDDLLSLEAVEHYFDLLYWSKQDEWDKHEIMKCFHQAPTFQFRTAASDYRLIPDEQHAIIVPYESKGRHLIGELVSMREAPRRAFSRQAQRFTVGVYEWQLKKLQQATLVTLYHDRFWVLDEPDAYDPELGLRSDLTGRNPESLVV